MEPSTGACRSPITSSSVNSTAATGVLNAAASAAAAPTGINSRILIRSQAQAPAEYRRDSRAYLYRRSFAPQSNAARKRRRTASELAQHRAHGDVPIAQE